MRAESYTIIFWHTRIKLGRIESNSEEFEDDGNEVDGDDIGDDLITGLMNNYLNYFYIFKIFLF